MSEQFTCARCGCTFDNGWSHAEAMAEYTGRFFAAALDDAAVLCDDCFERFWAWMKANGITGRLSEDRAKLAAMEDPGAD